MGIIPKLKIMKKNEKPMTYAGSGVDYEAMDPFKRAAQLAGLSTDKYVDRFGFKVVPWTRGESVFLLETPLGYLGLVIEGLGTKSLVADSLAELDELAAKMESLLGKSFYDKVAQCNAAMAFNDLITLGALPLIYGQYIAVQNSDWFSNKNRSIDLIEGTRRACMLARCTWGCGETPTLRGIIVPGTVDLAGATIGIVPSKDRLIDPANIRHGDAIVLIESSGIHANGLSMARGLADQLPEGYLTLLSNGKTYGETLLEPTHIYVSLVEDCLNQGVKIHYTVNITGHGWRKLMRANQPFTYVVEHLPTQLPIFDFVQQRGPVEDEEAYGNLNMGAGFALYVSPDDVANVIRIAAELGFKAFHAGYIEDGDKKVIIEPKGLEYAGKTLGVR